MSSGGAMAAPSASNLAMRHPDRVGKIFAFAAPTMTSGTKNSAILNHTIAAFFMRAGREYKAYSATPKEFGSFFVQNIRCGQASRTGRMRPQDNRRSGAGRARRP